MTMEELAFACEVEYSQISRIERGKTNTTLTTLDALAKGLGLTMEDLLHKFHP
jgi:transcriptional regulator with XRE-family HTH domain